MWSIVNSFLTAEAENENNKKRYENENNKKR